MEKLSIDDLKNINGGKSDECKLSEGCDPIGYRLGHTISNTFKAIEDAARNAF